MVDGHVVREKFEFLWVVSELVDLLRE